jgi:hypothetical protein
MRKGLPIRICVVENSLELVAQSCEVIDLLIQWQSSDALYLGLYL